MRGGVDMTMESGSAGNILLLEYFREVNIKNGDESEVDEDKISTGK